METNNYNFNNVDTRKRVITISDFAEYEHLQMMRKIYENYDENFMTVLAEDMFNNQDFYIKICYTGLATYLHYDNTGRLQRYVDPYGNYIDGDDVHIVNNIDELPL